MSFLKRGINLVKGGILNLRQPDSDEKMRELEKELASDSVSGSTRKKDSVDRNDKSDDDPPSEDDDSFEPKKRTI